MRFEKRKRSQNVYNTLISNFDKQCSTLINKKTNESMWNHIDKYDCHITGWA